MTDRVKDSIDSFMARLPENVQSQIRTGQSKHDTDLPGWAELEMAREELRRSRIKVSRLRSEVKRLHKQLALIKLGKS